MDDNPANEILAATYRALCKHGYADLTLRDIAAESDKSKATIHYHYDTKDELFEAFLEFLYEEYTALIRSVSGTTHLAHLHSILELLLTAEDAAAGQELHTAMLEVKAQAPYDEAIQRQLRRFDAFLSQFLTEIIEAGVEDGEFDDAVDPARVAELLTTTIAGARTRNIAIDRPTEPLYETVMAYLETQLVADETEVAP